MRRIRVSYIHVKRCVRQVHSNSDWRIFRKRKQEYACVSYTMMIYVLLQWTPSLNDRSKLKGECTAVSSRCVPSEGPGLNPHSLSFKKFLWHCPFKGSVFFNSAFYTTVPFYTPFLYRSILLPNFYTGLFYTEFFYTEFFYTPLLFVKINTCIGIFTFKWDWLHCPRHTCWRTLVTLHTVSFNEINYKSLVRKGQFVQTRPWPLKAVPLWPEGLIHGIAAQDLAENQSIT